MIKDFLINENKFIKDALLLLEKNGRGTLFVINDQNQISGILTDGDLRRFFIKKKNINKKIKFVMNKKFKFFYSKDSKHKVLKKLNKFKKKIKYIPIVDSNKKIIDYASPQRLNMIPIYETFLRGNESKYLNYCISNNWISSAGGYVIDLKNKFSSIFKNKNLILCSSGTAALHLALLSLGIKKGDEVIIPDLTFAAVINTVIQVGAKPVIVDIDKETWNIDFKEIKKKISKKTKAIIVVHLFGNVCDVKKLKQIIQNKKIKIIEDCAEAIGSRINNKLCGKEGDISTFSFYGNKTITTGEGGMLIFKNKAHKEKALLYRDHGMDKSKRYWHILPGLNYRMTNLQAAIGLAQAERIKEIIKKKISISKYYIRNLKDQKLITFQKIPKKVKSTYWAFGIILDDKKINLSQFQKKLKDYGIETRKFFYPLTLQPPYKKFKSSENKNTYSLSKFGICLPSFVDIKRIELDYIVTKIKDVLKNYSSQD